MKRKASVLMVFGKRPKVDDLQLNPLTAGRLLVLQERENPVVRGLQEGQVLSADAVFELMMVAALDDEELAEVCVTPAALKLELARETHEAAEGEAKQEAAERVRELEATVDMEWRRALRVFANRVPEDTVEKFWEVAEAEMIAIRKAQAVPAKKTTPRPRKKR